MTLRSIHVLFSVGGHVGKPEKSKGGRDSKMERHKTPPKKKCNKTPWTVTSNTEQCLVEVLASRGCGPSPASDSAELGAAEWRWSCMRRCKMGPFFAAVQRPLGNPPLSNEKVGCLSHQQTPRSAWVHCMSSFYVP